MLTYYFSSYDSQDKILLIEDNEGDARLVEIYLLDSDLRHCTVVNKQTLKEGLEELRKQKFAAVLLDLSLPDSRGFNTLETLLKHFPQENIIVMTGLSDYQLGLASIKAGAQDFLVKGQFEPEILAKTLRYSIERRRVLERLEESQRIAKMGNWEYDFQSNIIVLSDTLFQILEIIPRKEPIAISELQHVFLPEEIKQIVSQVENNQISKEEVTIDISYLSNLQEENSIRYLSVTYAGIFSLQNELVRIRGVAQDITDRKRAELELIKSQERYQSIFAQSKDAIFLQTYEGSIVYYNPATVTLFGYSQKELEKIAVQDLYDSIYVYSEIGRILQKQKFIDDYEIIIRRGNGEKRFCLVSVTPTNVGEFSGYQVILQDITDKKQTEELRKAKEVAEATSKMREEFLTNISHEIRTPMNAILGMTHLLLRTELDTEQYKYVDAIYKASDFLLHIINDILIISKLQSGHIDLEYAEFDLMELLTNLVNIVQFKAEEKHLELSVSIEENVHQIIIGDKQRLHQILMNLVSNAIKFTEEGGISIHVKSLGCENDHINLEFIVKDTGAGIPQDKFDAIFETFTQISTDIRKKNEGTGLGLSIVKNLVELQGGTVRLESEVGVGTTFFITLQYKSAKKNKSERLSVERNVNIAPNLVKPDIKILLVEDHKMNQIIAKKILETEWKSIVVDIADNGKIGIEMFEKNEYDLILMDLQMPIMDGYEATEHIRKFFTPPKSYTPILAMTAHAFIAEDVKYKKMGFDDFIIKPFSPKELFEKIVIYINEFNHKYNMKQEQKFNTYQYIDLSYMDLMSDGDIDIKKTMLSMLFEEPLHEIKSMKELCAAKNWRDLKNVSHKMKSTLSFFGKDPIVSTNKEIEYLAMNNKDTERIAGLVDELEKLYLYSLEELKDAYSKLN